MSEPGATARHDNFKTQPDDLDTSYSAPEAYGDGTRRSTRQRTLTHKAQENMERDNTDKFWRVNKTCKQVCDEIEKELDDYCSAFRLDGIMKELSLCEKDLNTIYADLRETLQSTIPQEIRLASDRTRDDIQRLMSKTINFTLSGRQNSMNISHHSFDNHSQHSGVSALSKESSTSSKRILLAAQAAALQVEQEARRKEAMKRSELNRLEAEEIARQAQMIAHRAQQDAEEKTRRAQIQVELDRRRQELEDQKLAIELQKTEAELKTLNDLTSEDPAINFEYISQQPKPIVSSHESTGISEANITSMMKTFVESVNLSRLPAPEPAVFSGDPLKYPSWKASFTALIDSRGIAPLERIHYLRKYLAGDAKEVVEGTFYFESEEAYGEARTLLEHRYGNSFLIAEAFRDKLYEWPKVSARDNQGLRKFADFLQQCLLAMSQIKGLEILNDCRENRKILTKLPDWLIQRWSRIIAESNDSYPCFQRFVKFVAKEAEIACHPITSLTLGSSNSNKKEDNSRNRPQTKRYVGANTLANDTSSTIKETAKLYCFFCKKTNHNLNECNQFRRKKPFERKDFLMKNGLCFGCLSHGHRSKDCPSRSTCDKCKGRHPSCLHGDYEALNPNTMKTANNQVTKEKYSSTVQKKSETPPTNAVSCRTYRENDDSKSSMIVPVYLSCKDKPDDEYLVYALLDTQSDTTFILEDTSDKLETSHEPARLKLSTMTSTSLIDCRRFKNLQVRGIRSTLKISLPTTYSREFIPVHRAHIPTSDTAKNWPHLEKLASEIPSDLDCEVGLLIGYNCPQALAPRDFIRGNGDEPFAQQTDLGWSIVGRTKCSDIMDEDSDVIGVTHRVISKKIPDILNIADDYATNEVRYVCRTNIKEEMLIPQVIKILETDFPERKHEDKVMSQEDLKFIEIMQHGIHQDGDGYYEMPLPFKHSKPELPNNRFMAMKRLEYLKRRFKANQKYYSDYKKFMDDILHHGDAEEVLAEDMDSSYTWYIPHHGVYHPKKPEKIRVVFDCSAKFKGTALNDHLLQGPDLMNSLIGVLCRFREQPIAIMGDVERMFHQFRVNHEDRDYLRFLWWKDGNLDSDPTVYRMKVHLFGATSSPGCANYGLKKIASDNKDEFGEEVTNFLTNDFYVDDGLMSFGTVQEAIQLVNDARNLCARGNLRLHKFVSNSNEVMDSIPTSERATNLKTLDMNFEDSPIERALGIQWCVEFDHFQFRLMLHEKPMTRRGILSTVASVYDPLGCLSPFVLIGKQILQLMCKENAGWDDPLSEELRPRWERWLLELPMLADIRIQRCFIPEDFGTITSRELHHFSDASFSGYGQCSYLRLVNDKDQVYCSLVMGKARVCPLKVVTIPRLELTAALVSVKISNLLRTEMRQKSMEEYFWTDSKVVLGYINNDARRFHVFVANRIQQIKDNTKAHQWRYVSTDQNPADHSSRGLHASELTDSTWFTGPTFLWNLDLPAVQHVDIPISPEDPEVRKVIVHTAKVEEDDILLKRLEHFSDWTSTITAIAALLRLISQRKKDVQKIPLSIEDRHKAEMMIIKRLQAENFAEEIEVLTTKEDTEIHVINKKSNLYRLDPFLDSHGILRVGGRLKRSSMLYGMKHPIILPRSGHIVDLIIRHYHARVAHQGRGFTLNEIRSNGYWIIGSSKAVSSYIYRCVICRKLRGRLQTQKMADLPEDRIEPSPPFTHCGIDCFGPFVVKEGRKELKRYGLLVTCMASRAVHIEVLEDMSTDAFINGLRCVIALRGPVRSIRCDQGSNFVGAAHTLKEALNEIKDKQIRDFLTAHHCDFIMNSPHSSHMGGTWERHIRTIRSVLTAILNEHGSRLDTPSLRTFMYETMAIINSRPLSLDSLNDPHGLEPLTPNHLITMKSKILLPPPGNFVKEDVYARKQWRKVQFLANEFWCRWRKEYLLGQQVRQKWNKPQRNITIGDVVILKDEDLIRGNWRIAKVTETFPDKDNLVRRVKILVGDPDLSKDGKRRNRPTILERPVHKLTVLLENSMEKL